MAESMSTGWYYLPAGAGGGQQVGPLTWEELYAARTAGSIGSGDMVWHPALPQWTPAAQIPGLFPASAQAAQPAAQVAAQPAAYQPTAYQQPGYQQPQYQQPQYQQPAYQQPGWDAQAGYQQPAGRSRSRLWLWLGPLIALVVIGAGLGAYFGVWYNKDGGGDPLPDDYYGQWAGTITYTSIDIDDPSTKDEATRDKILGKDIPMTIDISGLGDKQTAEITIDLSAVDPGLKKITDEFKVNYSESKDTFTFKSEASGDTATAEVAKRGGQLEMEGELTFKATGNSGEATWTVTK